MFAALELLFLAFIWGASFALYRVAIPEFGLLATVHLRLILATAVLWAVFGSPIKALGPRPGTARLGWVALAGLTSTALPFILFAGVVMRSSAGFASILNATSPFFTALIGAVWLGQHLGRPALGGLLLGLAGVIWLALERQIGPLHIEVDVILIGLFAAGLYGLATVTVKRHLSDLPPGPLAGAFTLVGALAITPWALPAWPNHLPSMSALAGLFMLGAVSTAWGNVMYFRLVGRVGATPAMAVTFLLPPFSMGWGYVLFDEQVSAAMLASTAVIFAGTALVMNLPARWRRMARG